MNRFFCMWMSHNWVNVWNSTISWHFQIQDWNFRGLLFKLFYLLKNCDSQTFPFFKFLKKYNNFKFEQNQKTFKQKKFETKVEYVLHKEAKILAVNKAIKTEIWANSQIQHRRVIKQSEGRVNYPNSKSSLKRKLRALQDFYSR